MSLEHLLLSWHPSQRGLARTRGSRAHASVDLMNQNPLSQPTLSLSTDIRNSTRVLPWTHPCNVRAWTAVLMIPCTHSHQLCSLARRCRGKASYTSTLGDIRQWIAVAGVSFALVVPLSERSGENAWCSGSCSCGCDESKSVEPTNPESIKRQKPFTRVLPWTHPCNIRAWVAGVRSDASHPLAPGESGPLIAIHLSRHKWPGRLVN